jgi:hypothetical protein
MWNREFLDPELLGKQKHLEELSLQGSAVKDFEFDPENCHIEKLAIDSLGFLNDIAFEKFSEFMKIQESVTELALAFGRDELMEPNRNYSGALTHLLSLESLKKFSFDCACEEHFFELFSNLKIFNPAVETLIIENPHPLYADLASLPKLFPNVTDLKITWPSVIFYDLFPFDYFFVDLQPINSMTMIRKLEIEYACWPN